MVIVSCDGNGWAVLLNIKKVRFAMKMKFLKSIMLLLGLMPALIVGKDSESGVGRDILLEFKAAAFLPSDCLFKKIYDSCAALYDLELTFELVEDKNWFMFLSLAYTSKQGHSVGFCTPTTVQIVPFGLGFKYFFPCSRGDFYVGLGVQPAYLGTNNCSEFVCKHTSDWGVGGVSKIGFNFDLPKNWFCDLFFDYSFVRVGKCTSDCSSANSCSESSACCDSSSNFVVPLKADISGAILGLGFGYKF